MKMRVSVCTSVLLAVTGVVALPAPVEAHHSFAMFDKTKAVAVNGIVRKIEWTNPHIYFFVEAKDAKGLTSQYAIEAGSINLLARKGWKANSLKVGDKVTANIFPLRNGQPGGLLDSMTLPNGSLLKG